MKTDQPGKYSRRKFVQSASAVAALAPSERRVDVLNSMLLFGIAFLGGSYLPADNFPRFM